MNDTKTPRELLKEALSLQEQGEFLEAMALENEALIQFQTNHDYAGMAEITILRSKTLKHLYQSTEDINYLILARSGAQAAVEIVEKAHLKEAAAIPYFVLAQMHEALEEYTDALHSYQKSLEYLKVVTTPGHNRKSVKADIEGHLAYCMFKSGNPIGIDQALEALTALENTDDANEYEYDVWRSGAHMRLAAMYEAQSNTEHKNKHVSHAQEIINANEQLVLRKKQLTALIEKIK
jgi:tetratricopeptide (TPR) repeat protein